MLENPAMAFNPTPGVDRPFLLFCSGGEWQVPNNYGTGYAACATPLSGCVRLSADRPRLRSRGTNAGPGGLSPFPGPGGPWVTYHTYRQGQVMDGSGRRLHVEPLTFGGSRPRLQDRPPTGTISGSSPGVGTVHLQGT